MNRPLPNTQQRPPRRPGALQRGFTTILRLGIALVALAIVLGALLLGLLLALGVAVWALIRGRRPPTEAFRTPFQRAQRRYAREHDVQVVDVDTRVVPESEVK